MVEGLTNLNSRLQPGSRHVNQDKRQIQISKIQVTKRKGGKMRITSGHLQKMSGNVFANTDANTDTNTDLENTSLEKKGWQNRSHIRSFSKDEWKCV